MVRPRRGATKFGCLLYLLFLSAILYIIIPIGETYFRYQEYKDAMRQELRFRANLPNDKIRLHLRAQADSLGLPEEAGDVTVHRQGNEISVEAEYDESIKILAFKKQIHFVARAVDTY
jgi:hypothetical protein